MPANPTVAVVVHATDGASLPGRALEALCSQGTPAADPIELLIPPGLSAVARTRRPAQWALRELRCGPGRADVCNAAADASTAEWLLFLAADCVPEPGFVADVVRAAEIARADLVCATICDEQGSVVQCGWSVGPDGHAAPARQDAGSDLFAPCLDAMLIRRPVFTATGGLDPAYRGVSDDVDLAWRARLLGARLAGSDARVVGHPRRPTAATRLAEERNAIATLYKCVGDERVFRRIASALGRALARIMADCGLAPADVRRLEAGPDEILLGPGALATLAGLDELTLWLPRLRDIRARVQRERRVPDTVIAGLFGAPRPVPDSWTSSVAALDDMLTAPRGGAPAVSGPHDDDPGRREARPSSPASASPDVSVIVLTATGATHLPSCLDAIHRLDYPRERLEIIVADNASAVSPEAFVRAHPGRPRLLRFPQNLGFCGGNNRAAAAAAGRWLLFLNDDTAIEPGALTALLATAERDRSPCVGALLLDWPGDRIDFGAGAANFEGKGFVLGLGSRDVDHWGRDRATLFASGAGMLVRRDLFLALGGFDDTYFAYYEDVAFGWLLWILGERVSISGGARVRHRHHGTSGTRSAARARLCERNSLLTVATHVEDAGLGRSLAAALLLTVSRAVLAAGLQTETGVSTVGYPRVPLRMVVRALRAGLSRRGARRADGVLTNVRRVGAQGLIRATIEAFRLSLFGTSRRRRANTARVLTNAGSAGDVACRLEPEAAAPLAGAAGWLARASEASRTRQVWQARRVRTDAEILAALPGGWLQALPAPDQPLYAIRHDAVLSALQPVAAPVEQI